MIVDALRSLTGKRRPKAATAAMRPIAAVVNQCFAPPVRRPPNGLRPEEGTQCLHRLAIVFIWLADATMILIHDRLERRVLVEIILTHHTIVMSMIDFCAKVIGWVASGNPRLA